MTSTDIVLEHHEKSSRDAYDAVVADLANAERGSKKWTRARDRLVAMHYAMAVRLASRFRRPSLDMDDLVQAACEGLLIAANKFDPRRGFRFSTYATWWVRNRLMDWRREGASIIRPPRLRGKEGSDSIQRCERWETIDDVATADPCGPTLDDLEEREAAIVAHVRSHLTEREADILLSRAGLGCEPQTLSQIAQRLGISREWVRKIEVKAAESLPIGPDLMAA